MNIKSLIRSVPDFPKPGIRFRDITPLLASSTGLRHITRELANRYEGKVDKVAAIEARGFIFGSMLAHALNAGFVPIRKPGKLPGETIGHNYSLEYGINRVELHVDAVAPDERVVVVDDLLATGGTARAALALLERLHARVVGCAFVIDLPEVGGRAKLERAGYEVHALCSYVDAE
ncbi:MAG: adenine phosphoribosyltransferase [Deltaproteobacteria bacterium]|nr:adenine phosphoribosyltransferase [Deltaproteobacteria bacterium]MBA3819515.1 adenine phosphoribosyltransferase [Deltaproteobacteria bacterium]